MNSIRTFQMIRHIDVSGASGTGVVAMGVVLPSGRVIIDWQTERHSTVIWDSLEDAIAIHGHDGKTEFVFDKEKEK